MVIGKNHQCLKAHVLPGVQLLRTPPAGFQRTLSRAELRRYLPEQADASQQLRKNCPGPLQRMRLRGEVCFGEDSCETGWKEVSFFSIPGVTCPGGREWMFWAPHHDMELLVVLSTVPPCEGGPSVFLLRAAADVAML